MKKRFATILITLAILMSTGIVAYAVVKFITTETQMLSFTKKEYFEMSGSVIFAETSEVGPGVEVSINPAITSKSSVNMYVFIRVEMAEYNDAGLYSLDLNNGWSFVEGSSSEDRYIAVYRYNSVLTPGVATSALQIS